MKMKLVILTLVVALLPIFGGVALAQSEPTSVCLVTDVGRVNDGSFNQSAYEGMLRAAADFNLDMTYIETQAQTDYAANLQTCIDNGFEIIVVVGYLMYDATIEAAHNNPDVYFIGVDQTAMEVLPNYVGLQYREDQAGFLAGAMAALMTESGKVGGVYGVDMPPVRKFRNGFEQGVRFVNPSVEIFGVYIPDFNAPQLGAEAAHAFVSEQGVDVVFGAGGPTGSGAIVRAAELGAYVIGVDLDEYLTTFGSGETPGAHMLITSAIKRVDNSVYDMIELLANGEVFPDDSVYLMAASNDGVGFAPPHDSAVPDTVVVTVAEIYSYLQNGTLTTGVDPVTGDLGDETSGGTAGVRPSGQSKIMGICLVTDVGLVTDGGFNQSAYEGLERAARDFDLPFAYYETGQISEYESHISDCIGTGYDAIITVGYLIAAETAAAAALHPNRYFIGVDQFHSASLPNLVGIQFREDQAGFLAGVMAAQLTQSGIVGGVYGVEIPPVMKFRNGFEQGARFINPDIELLGVYIPDFLAPALGVQAADEFIGKGADVIFGAGGPTGSGAILHAAERGLYVIGVDADEYFTTFDGGAVPFSSQLVTSAIKRVDQGVYDMVALLANGGDFPIGSLYLMDTSVDGVGLAPAHDAVIPAEIYTVVDDVYALLSDGSLNTGVDILTGELMGR